MKNILFITSNRIGDAVLSTGALNRIIEQHPDARITVVCGPLPAPLFEGAPRVGQIIAMQKKPHGRHWFDLWRDVVRQKWDLVIDLRDTAVSRLLLSQETRRLKRGPKKQHKVEEIANSLGLTPAPTPHLWFSDDDRAKASQMLPTSGPILALTPTANWEPKQWPADRFAKLARHLTAEDGILANAPIAIFAAPNEKDQVEKVLQYLTDRQVINLTGAGNLREIGACISRCSMCVSNDSGLMHIAAATGIPTLGLFGPSDDRRYRPWGTHASFIRTGEGFEALLLRADGRSDVPNLMQGLTVTAAQSAAESLWRARP